MKKLFSLACMLLTVASAFALTITPGKVYKIANRNDNNLYVKDDGSDIIKMGALDENSYWTFEATANGFYVKNVKTGRYAQQCATNAEVNVTMGKQPVEYSVVDCSEGEGADCFGLTSTNESVTNFTAGCIGWNWKGDNTVQTFAAVSGTNHRSFWKITEVENYVPYTGNAVAAGEEWYLYNVETGYWLGNNNHKWGDWTTRANANKVGLDWRIEAIDGGWRLDPKYGHNGSMNSSNFYLDTNDGVTAWVFEEVACEGATKAYKIHAGDKYLGVVLGTNDKQELGYQLDFDGNTQGTWVLVTREQRLAIASETNPVDASFLIPCYDMGDNNPRYAWTLTTNGEKNGPKVMWEHNRVWETWNVTQMDAYTTCNNIPNGKYLVYSIGAYVPTGGSGMNGNDYDDYKTRGSESVHALAYANNATAKMASVYSVENDHQENERWTKEVKTGVWVPSGWGAIANQCGHYDKYWSDPVEVVVTNNTLRLGVKMDDEAPNSSWVVFSGMRMEYLGEVADILTPALEALNAAITAAQAIDQSKLTTAAEAALSSALTAAQALTESTDVEAIGNATNDLNNVVGNVKDMNATALKAAVEYMSGRGYNDAAANDVLANATTASAVNDAVNGLKNRFKQHVADKSVQPTEFTKVTEAVLGEQNNERTFVETEYAKGLYIYNVGTGRWFCGGDDWGAHAAIGFPGIKVTLPEDNFGTGKYNGIVTHLYNGNWGNGGKLNHDGYCDTGGNGWKFYNVDASKGIVTIARNGSNTGDQAGNDFGRKNLVGFSDNTLMRVDTNKQGAENPNNQWIFVTEAQRDAMAQAAMASASTENPVDLTYKIGMPGFNQRERLEGTNQDSEKLAWTCNHANYRYNAEDNGSRHAICERGSNHADFCIDIYGGQWNDAFSWTQTISNLAPGKYRVKVQGYNNRGAEENQAKLVANDESKVLRQADTEAQLPWVGRLADNTWEAVEYFENGCYWNEVVVDVLDGDLTIGVTSPSMQGDHVVLFDNFRLEYIGEVTDEVTVSEAGYATYVAPFDITEIPSTVKAYAAQNNGEYVHLEPVAQIPAGEAVVLKNEGTHTFTASATTATLGTENDLKAATEDVVANGTQYVLAKVNGEVGFNKAISGTTIKAGKAYLVIAAGAKAFYSFGENQETAIEKVEAAAKSQVIYNVAGQRMQKTQKGLNIVDGKKVIK